MKNLFKKLKLKRRIITWLAGMHFYGNPSVRMKVVGVTGTNGKTTTATLLYRIASALGYKAGLISTVENMIAGEKRRTTYTTPDPLALSRLLNEMSERGCEYVFMEVSSHALDQKRVAGVTFAGGIFSNLTHDHLDYHKNLEAYFRAKKKFFQMLPAGAFALSNLDDGHGIKMLEGITARKFFYGFGHNPEFKGEIKQMDFEGLKLAINGRVVTSRLLGKFNAYNLLAVWSASSLLGFGMDKVGQILESIEPPRGRFEHFMSSGGVLAIVDYAHTPDALEKILVAVKEIKGKNGKLISLFGCGGDRDPLKRPIMGNIGATLSDLAIFTSDNPRSEDSDMIIADMKKNLSAELSEKVKTIANRREAIKEAAKIAQKGDIILAAGKGHEDYQIVKSEKLHFDDMEELKKAFTEK